MGGSLRRIINHPRTRFLRTLLIAAAVALSFGLAHKEARAQFPFGGGGGGGRNFGSRSLPKRDIFPGSVFTFCTMEYNSVTREALGLGWSTDFPDAGLNFMTRLAEMTTIQICREPNGEPHQETVRLTDEALFGYPIIFSSDVGTLEFSEDEVETLREYLLRGGFLHVDDFWGTPAWLQWEEQIGRVLPPDEYPIFDLPPNHPVYNIVFKITEAPQVPSIQWWSGSHSTSERGSDSEFPHVRGIKDKNGRLMVIMTYNTDIADGWEKEGENREYFEEFSVKKSYPLGINIVVYAMTH